MVTGGDRRDLQIAALETSTHCLILTGQIAPTKDVLTLAKDKEVPVLSVATDTLSTVERIDMLFGRLPLNNPDKIPLIKKAPRGADRHRALADANRFRKASDRTS